MVCGDDEPRSQEALATKFGHGIGIQHACSDVKWTYLKQLTLPRSIVSFDRLTSSGERRPALNPNSLNRHADSGGSRSRIFLDRSFSWRANRTIRVQPRQEQDGIQSSGRNADCLGSSFNSNGVMHSLNRPLLQALRCPNSSRSGLVTDLHRYTASLESIAPCWRKSTWQRSQAASIRGARGTEMLPES